MRFSNLSINASTAASELSEQMLLPSPSELVIVLDDEGVVGVFLYSLNESSQLFKGFSRLGMVFTSLRVFFSGIYLLFSSREVQKSSLNWQRAERLDSTRRGLAVDEVDESKSPRITLLVALDENARD